ncbi:mandelate racemase [Oceanicola granulosus HTCC2516]|uniref:L-fuconate dehydratase n=1 Tax=Oceanicola granulosus (strain ATCC BAA-861 / DSM 15982 / KCTC 12143 / HTCC2516) TaxID=314256 RepID=Q2CHH7_OCEGH|nr:enolase C-terminal domain-like protein [Oceanicola granulosus]EAR52062.1 mandelate racemase [Oceanicola granulosus HTCC2516]
MSRITGLTTWDLRFPSEGGLDGSDAMNPDPVYSAAYLRLETDGGHEGHGLTFTIGRGNELCVAAIEALRGAVVGRDTDDLRADPAGFWRAITGDSQLRWVGPEKGVIHLAAGAVVNAIWDLLAREAGKPVWRLVGEMSPEELVAIPDFRYMGDYLDRAEALELLQEAAPGKADRIATLEAEGYPCYTTSAGWLGYPDDKLRRLCREARAAGFGHVKMKVGRDLDDDIRRLTIAREELGEDITLMIDANQVWEVPQAVDWVKRLAFARPWFIEEPTSPDDVLGHKAIREAVAPIKVATGEMCQNRVMFKQFIAAGAIDVVQIDSCRLGGLNEVLAVQLMAAKAGLPVWPHAGGVGLCEYVQHLSMIDYVAVAGTREGRVIEFVDHLHEHFTDPCIVRDGAYMAPSAPGFSSEIRAETRARFAHPAEATAAE